MIKVSVLYQNNDDSHFDMEYYCNKHMPMVKNNLGMACKKIKVDQGIGVDGISPAPPFIAIGHMYFDSVDDFQTAFAPHAKEIMDDAQNYTNIQPTIQISDIKTL